MGLNLMILNMVYVISFSCSLYIGVTLFKIGKNSLAVIYCLGYCLLCCNVLSGVVFHNNLASAPKAFCFFQGYAVQFISYITTMSALCFSHETYSLIVNYRPAMFGSKKIYYLLIMIYPFIFGIPLFIVCLKTDAIIPRELKCDVASPVWVRLLGYSGANLLLAIPGTYFTARSTYVLYKHMDQFEASIENISQNSGILYNVPSVQTPTSQQFSQKQINLNQRRYNMTKEVIIRMLVFCSSFVLSNFLASITTLIGVFTHKPLETHISLNDWVGAFMGIYTFFIFGFSREIRGAWNFGYLLKYFR